MHRQIFHLLLKVLVLYLIYPLYVIMLTIIQINIPMIYFVREPFIHVSVLVIVLGSAISLKLRSKTPMIWSIFCVAFSGMFFLHKNYIGALIAFFLITGAINFIYRNKFTEPLLVFLPIISGSLMLVSPVYSNYLGVWGSFVAGINAFEGTTIQELVIRALFQTAIVIPIMAMYFLGNHSYVGLHSIVQCLRPGRAD